MEVKKSIDSLTHQNAYNEFRQLVNIETSEKYTEGKKNTFYLYYDLTFEMIIKENDDLIERKNQKHFAIKSNVVINGHTHKRNDINGESVEHYEAKVKIARNGFFRWNDYNIHIIDPKIEKILEGSKYRSDLYAKMTCGTEITIEVIKSSEISDSKMAFIKQKQIPTFIIYIDNYGNQKFDRFDLIGNTEIERISERIRKGTITVSGIISERKQFERELLNIERDYSQRILKFKNQHQREIEDMQDELYNAEQEYARERNKAGYVNGEKVRIISWEIKKNIDTLRSAKEEIFNITKSIKENIIGIKKTKQNIQNYNGVLIFFKDFKYNGSVKLNNHTKIIDVNKFVKSHLSTILNNLGKKTFEPYYLRLLELKKHLNDETT